MSVFIVNIGKFCILVYLLGMLLSVTGSPLTQKSLRLLLVLYIIAVILNSFRTTSWQIDMSLNKITEGENFTSSDYIIPAVQQEIEDAIKNQLDEKNISYKDVNVHIIEQKEYIKIDEIVFYGISDNNKSLVESFYVSEGNVIFGD